MKIDRLRAVPNLMLTQRLWVQLGGGRQKLAPPRPDDGRSRLGDWGAQSFPSDIGDLVLFANQRSMLCVLSEPGPLEALAMNLRANVLHLLQAIGIPRDTIRAEDAALADLFLAKQTDRSLLGSMNDLTGHAQWHIYDELEAGRKPDLRTVQAQLNDIPHVKRNPSFPRQAVGKLFGMNVSYR
jgi:hypothetical protein